MNAKTQERLLKILVPLDAFLVALFFAKARKFQTFSSMCWEWDLKGHRSWPRKIVDWLFAKAGDVDHCRTSWENEQAK